MSALLAQIVRVSDKYVCESQFVRVSATCVVCSKPVVSSTMQSLTVKYISFSK